jgi:hypothetical protein
MWVTGNFKQSAIFIRRRLLLEAKKKKIDLNSLLYSRAHLDIFLVGGTGQ